MNVGKFITPRESTGGDEAKNVSEKKDDVDDRREKKGKCK